jgi:hypothetical protein
MSKTQTEYKTEYETDAEPTPGPVTKGVTSSPKRRIAKVLKGTNMVGEHNTHCDIHSKRHRIEGQEPVANADLIVAAFNAAQQTKEMGYNPQKAVEALPGLLAVLQDIDGMIEQLRYGTIRKMVNDALASAEGNDQ